MRYIFIVLLLTIVCSEIKAQSYGLDNAGVSTFFKFRIPETDLRKVFVNAGFNFNSSDQNSKNLSNDADLLRTTLYSYINPEYYLLKESDERYFSLNVKAKGNYSQDYIKNESRYIDYMGYEQYNESTQKRTVANLELFLNGTYRNYWGSNNLFYSASSNIDMIFNETNTDGPSQNSDNGYKGYKTRDYSFSLGVGWGKFRNVTQVVSAIRFQERLKQLNLLNTNLNDKTIEDLAEQFSRQMYYKQVHDRPEKYFWQDIEKIIINDNVLPVSGLNQYASSYLHEVPDELRFLRNEGLITELNLKVKYSYNYTSAYDEYYQELFTLGGLAISYSHQISLNSQIYFNLTLSGGPNLEKIDVTKQLYDMGAIIGYDHELTDRFVGSIKNSFSLSFENSEVQKKMLSDDLSVSLNYFLEDNLTVNSIYKWSYSDRKFVYNDNPNFTYNDNSIVFGFTYFFDRGFL